MYNHVIKTGIGETRFCPVVCGCEVVGYDGSFTTPDSSLHCPSSQYSTLITTTSTMFRTVVNTFLHPRQGLGRSVTVLSSASPKPRFYTWSSAMASPSSSSSAGDSHKTEERSIDDIIKSIDTTLTPEQKEYVASLKKKLRGSVNTKPSVYRNVPKPEDIIGMGNFMPKMADNAEELIDFALSHIPKRKYY